MQVLFSIIIPVYKVEEYLRKCLDSVLQQTLKDWECICVDDGSPDNSGAILDEYAKRDGRFKVIHQANGGVSVARNAALDVAKGEWVQFLDGDDSLELDFLEKLSDAIVETPGVDAFEHTAIYCYDDGRKVYGDGGRLPPAGVVDAEAIRRDPFGKKYTSLGRCSCYKIFRRNVIERNHLRFTPGIPVSEDALFAGRFYSYASKIAICPDIAGYLRIFRDGSALMTIRAEKIIPKLKAAEILVDTWVDNPAPGFDVWVASNIMVSYFLGAQYGAEMRKLCIDAILSSRFMNGRAVWFLLRHGTRKMRLFACVYASLPKAFRRLLLNKLAKGS